MLTKQECTNSKNAHKLQNNPFDTYGYNVLKFVRAIESATNLGSLFFDEPVGDAQPENTFECKEQKTYFAPFFELGKQGFFIITPRSWYFHNSSKSRKVASMPYPNIIIRGQYYLQKTV